MGSVTPFLGLSGASLVSAPGYPGTPGPGPAPSPWKVNGATVFYDEGGVVIPDTVPGGDKGKGTINAEGVFENGIPIVTSGGTPGGPAGGDLAGTYPDPTIKPSVALTGVPTAPDPTSSTDNSEQIPTTKWVNAAIAGATPTPPAFPATEVLFGGGTTGSHPAVGDVSMTYNLVSFTFQLKGTQPQIALYDTSHVNGVLLTQTSGYGALMQMEQLPLNLGAGGHINVILNPDGSTTVRPLWNNAATNYVGFTVDIVDTAHGSSSLPMKVDINGVNKFYVDPFGNTVVAGGLFAQGSQSAQLSTAIPAGGLQDVGYLFSSTPHQGLIFGSGPPTAIMAQGSWYQRTDASATNPAFYYNSNGTAGGWLPMSSGGASVSVGATPPTSPAANSLWWSNVLGTMFIYYNDGNSTQWVPAAPAGAPTGPAGGVLAGNFPNPAFATGVGSPLLLFSEQVLAAPSSQLVVNFPTTARMVELVWDVSVTPNSDVSIFLIGMQGATPITSASYTLQRLYGQGSAAGADAQLNAASWAFITGFDCRGAVTFTQPALGRGTGTFGAVATSGVRTAATVSLEGGGITGLTGYRLACATVNFAAGSYMRALVLP